MNTLLQQNQKAIEDICQKNGVQALFLFGSALQNDLPEESDVDLAVVFKDELSPLERGDAFFEVLRSLEMLLNKRVDLVSYSVIRNPIFKQEVDRTKVPLYAVA